MGISRGWRTRVVLMGSEWVSARLPFLRINTSLWLLVPRCIELLPLSCGFPPFTSSNKRSDRLRSLFITAPPKRAHRGPDKHTKPPGGIPVTSGGHRSRSEGHIRGAKTPAFGGERRQFERRSGANPDSQKKVDQGWGPDQGEAELNGVSTGPFHSLTFS